MEKEIIEDVLQLLPPAIGLRNVKDYECVISELEVLKVQTKDINSFTEPKSVSQKMKHILPTMNQLIRLICTATISTTFNERSFSYLKEVKSPRRMTMTNIRLKNLLMANCNEDICDKINLKKLMEKWFTEKKKRRVNLE